jgi:hypothetical protein
MLETKSYSMTGSVFCFAAGVGWSYVFGGEFIGFLGTGVSFLLGALLMVDWFLGKRSDDRRIEMYADGNSPVNVINALARLDPDMQHNLTAARAVIETVPNFDGPSRTVRLPGCDVPFPEIVVNAVWDLVTERGMPAVRTWGDETQARRCAAAMISYFTGCGWCRPASGNQSAQWTVNGFELASRAMGFDQRRD